MSKALGQLPNAPLIYVLAQVRFTHVPRMASRWEEFHEKIFSDYPRAETELIERFVVKNGVPGIGDSIQRWHLVNESRKTGIIFDAGMLVFHTTDYRTSDVFLSDLANILSAFAQILPEKGVSFSRLGLRYVDLLLPEGELSVDQQVIEALRLPELPEEIGQAKRMEQTITYQTPVDGTINIRHRQSVTADVLPPDIFPNKLESAPRLKREQPDGTVVGVLDYDHFIEREAPFDTDVIIDGFRKLRKISSAAFTKTVTESALAEWSKEENQ